MMALCMTFLFFARGSSMHSALTRAAFFLTCLLMMQAAAAERSATTLNAKVPNATVPILVKAFSAIAKYK